MDPRIKEMLDHYEIQKLVSEYCRGCDRMDAELMSGVYAESSWDDHGPTKTSGPEFVRRTMELMKDPRSVAGSHMLGQTLIRVFGDAAGAETYFLASSRRTSEDGEFLNQLAGRYIDSLVRDEGEWRISKRICVRDWSLSTPIVADWLRDAGFADGKRSEEDPSYSVLKLS